MVKPREVDSVVFVPAALLHHGVTLLDLILMMSGAWGIPFAVEGALGRESRWRFVGYVSGGVLGLFWAWYCKKAGWFLHRVLLDEPAGNTPLSVVASMSLYVGVLLSSTLLQYALYRCLRFTISVAFAAP